LTTEKDGSFTLSKEEKARIIKLVDSELQQDNLEEDDEEEANDDDGEVIHRWIVVTHNKSLL
jgi:hypothetical protein